MEREEFIDKITDIAMSVKQMVDENEFNSWAPELRIVGNLNGEEVKYILVIDGPAFNEYDMRTRYVFAAGQFVADHWKELDVQMVAIVAEAWLREVDSDKVEEDPEDMDFNEIRKLTEETKIEVIVVSGLDNTNLSAMVAYKMIRAEDSTITELEPLNVVMPEEEEKKDLTDNLLRYFWDGYNSKRAEGVKWFGVGNGN